MNPRIKADPKPGALCLLFTRPPGPTQGKEERSEPQESWAQGLLVWLLFVKA